VELCKSAGGIGRTTVGEEDPTSCIYAPRESGSKAVPEAGARRRQAYTVRA